MTRSTPPSPPSPGAAPFASVEEAHGGWLVYLLQCADGTLYAGCTNDLPRRLRAHRGGRVKYTRGRLPVELVYQEPAAGRGATLSREAAIKRMPRIRKLKLLRQRTL